jgi:hypothetical protein
LASSSHETTNALSCLLSCTLSSLHSTPTKLISAKHSSIILTTSWGMSEHAQALMISTKVHAMFGITLMLAGLTRIIEICFFAPPSSPSSSLSSHSSSSSQADDDSISDRTVAEGVMPSPRRPSFVPNGPKEQVGRVFRHLPPFVSSLHPTLYRC